jgi:hypothetical protein
VLLCFYSAFLSSSASRRIPLVLVLFLSSYSSRPVPLVLFLSSYSSRPVPLVLFLPSCSSRPVPLVLFLSSYSSRPVPLVLFLSFIRPTPQKKDQLTCGRQCRILSDITALCYPTLTAISRPQSESFLDKTHLRYQTSVTVHLTVTALLILT